MSLQPFILNRKIEKAEFSKNYQIWRWILWEIVLKLACSFLVNSNHYTKYVINLLSFLSECRPSHLLNSDLKYHRITEHLWLKGIIEDPLVQPFCQGRVT